MINKKRFLIWGTSIFTIFIFIIYYTKLNKKLDFIKTIYIYNDYEVSFEDIFKNLSYNHNETWEIMKMVYESKPPEDLEKEKPLLTLFTSFKDFTKFPHHKFAHLLCILNWSSFGKLLRPVLFTDDIHNETGTDTLYPKEEVLKLKEILKDILNNKSLAYIAYKSGWSLLKLKHRNEFGTPFLKNMFAETFDKYDSWFYGFANGDLLFDESLTETLLAVKFNYLSVFKHNIFLVGRRTNVNFKVLKKTNSLEKPLESYDLYKVLRKYQKKNLFSVASKFGSLDKGYAIDYFIFTKYGNRFKWNSLANVVIGRVGYDNYLVLEAIKNKLALIDCSLTLNAVHLSKPGVSQTGRLNKDSNFNIRLIGKYPFFDGDIGFSPYYSTNINKLSAKQIKNHVKTHVDNFIYDKKNNCYLLPFNKTNNLFNNYFVNFYKDEKIDKKFQKENKNYIKVKNKILIIER